MKCINWFLVKKVRNLDPRLPSRLLVWCLTEEGIRGGVVRDPVGCTHSAEKNGNHRKLNFWRLDTWCIFANHKFSTSPWEIFFVAILICFMIFMGVPMKSSKSVTVSCDGKRFLRWISPTPLLVGIRQNCLQNLVRSKLHENWGELAEEPANLMKMGKGLTRLWVSRKRDQKDFMLYANAVSAQRETSDLNLT